MPSAVKRPLLLLLCLIAAVFLCMGIAHAIQTGGGSIGVSEGVLLEYVPFFAGVGPGNVCTGAFTVAALAAWSITGGSAIL